MTTPDPGTAPATLDELFASDYQGLTDPPNEDDHARAALDAWREGRPLDTVHARRVAAWWHSPGNADLSRFSHGIPVLVADVRAAIEREIRELRAVGGPDVAPEVEELSALLGYCDQHDDTDTV